MGHLINRPTREFFDEDINKIAQTYHNWRAADHVIASEAKQSHAYKDIKGFCKSATVGDVAVLDYVLTTATMWDCRMMKMISILTNALANSQRN